MKAIDKAKSFLKKYRHAWVLSYFLIYMPWFVYLEKRTNVRHYMIHSPIDNHIPFIEYFIVPYLVWFVILLKGVIQWFPVVHRYETGRHHGIRQVFRRLSDGHPVRSHIHGR